jgi:hypothetical protein
LLYEAFPYGRYGPRYATVRWLGTTVPNGAQVRVFHGFADLDEQIIVVDGYPRSLRAGMGGTAKIVLGRRALVDFALHPLRQFKQSFAAPPAPTHREQRS